jgi:PPK2 family polyphosphate:nucleotide phosphotransferase
MDYALQLDGERSIALADLETAAAGGLDRAQAKKLTGRCIDELAELQELLYAVQTHSVLVVLQGRDTSGKDGTIRNVFGPLDAQSCSVTSFKAPTPEELAHDFLWRIHAHTPRNGYIQIFNRSHYEDVLVARVRGLVPARVWRSRYRHINEFERLLHDSQTIILKFYLHISKEEQKKRLLDREKDRLKAWKLSVDDWKERGYWDDYTTAYEDMLNRCSTRHAPWFIVPADRKWFRNLAVAQTLRDALLPYRESWLEALDQLGASRKNALAEYRAGRSVQPVPEE